jgi:hypothetical protein
MGYGVIGSPTDSGSVSLGSSPGTPATDGAWPPGFVALVICKTSDLYSIDVDNIGRHGPVV